MRTRPAMTLAELLIAIGIIGVLSSVVLSTLDIGGLFGKAHDAQRRSDLNSILKAIDQFKIDHSRLPRFFVGPFDTVGLDTIPELPAIPLEICSLGIADGLHSSCRGLGFASLGELVPRYLPEIPIDPEYNAAEQAAADFRAPYRTRYQIWADDQDRVFVRSVDYNGGEGLTLPST